MKTLILTALTVLSLGIGTAMAQDSAFFTEQAQQMSRAASFAASLGRGEAQAGSSDVEQSGSQAVSQAALHGAAGTGG